MALLDANPPRQHNRAIIVDDISESIPLNEPHALPGPVLPAPETHKTLADKMPRGFPESGNFKSADILAAIEQGRLQQRFGLAGNEFFQIAGLFAQPQQGGANGRVVGRFEQWQQLVTNAIAGHPLIGIRFILAERLSELLQKPQNIIASYSQKGPQQPHSAGQRMRRGHATQSRDAGASHEVMQDRFDLIVGCMRHRDLRAAALGRDRCEQLSSRGPGGFFDSPVSARRLGRNIHSFNASWNPQRIAERLHPTGILICRGAQSVIQVYHR